MATAWDVASAGWAITVLDWLLSPIITLLLPKILSCLGFDTSQKLQELEIRIMLELENRLHAVDRERMMQRGKKSNSDVAALDKMAAMLRHGREDAEDIFDDEQEIKLYRNRFWHRLYRVVATCIARCKSSCVWISCIARSGSARLLRWVREFSLHTSEDVLPMTASALACIARFNRSCMWVARVVRSGSARLLHWVRKISLHGLEDVLPVITGVSASEGPTLVATNGAVSEELVSVTTSSTVLVS